MSVAVAPGDEGASSSEICNLNYQYRQIQKSQSMRAVTRFETRMRMCYSSASHLSRQLMPWLRQLPKHCVCLAAACLPVGEHCGVEALQARVHNWYADHCTKGRGSKTLCET